MDTSTNTSDNLPVAAKAAAVVLPMSPKAAVMRRINEEIPLNDYGLPEYIYRADMIPLDLSDLDTAERNGFMEQSIIELDYSQGFPTLPSGEPIWGQLPFEPADAHRAFTFYLDMPRIKSTKDGEVNAANAVRQVHAIKDQCGKTTQELLSLAHMFYWQQRALAYDLFITASHNKRREYMLQDVENEHLATAATFIKYAQDFLEQVFGDPEKYDLKPREAMDLLVKMIQVQRLSLGASPFGQKSGKSENELPSNAPLEVILRTIVQNSGMANGAKNGGQQVEDLTKQLLQDPENLRAAQELIIRMGDAKNPRSAKQVDQTETPI